MRKFNFNCKKLKIAGADVEIKRLTPAIFPDVAAILDKFEELKELDEEHAGKVGNKEILKLVLEMPEHKRCTLALTDLTEEEYDAMPFDVLFELSLEVTKENADFFGKALSKWIPKAETPTGQS